MENGPGREQPKQGPEKDRTGRWAYKATPRSRRALFDRRFISATPPARISVLRSISRHSNEICAVPVIFERKLQGCLLRYTTASSHTPLWQRSDWSACERRCRRTMPDDEDLPCLLLPQEKNASFLFLSVATSPRCRHGCLTSAACRTHKYIQFNKRKTTRKSHHSSTRQLTFSLRTLPGALGDLQGSVLVRQGASRVSGQVLCKCRMCRHLGVGWVREAFRVVKFSAVVGWMPIVISKSSLVAPSLMAVA